MNKQKTIGFAILLTAALLVVATGVVFAAGLNYGGPLFSAEGGDDDYGQYWGPMHGRGGGWSSEETNPPMHESMVQAVAENTDLTVEEINARITGGERLIEIALDAGMAEEEFFALMQEVREAFWNEAFEAGLISEERYQWMLERKAGDQYGPGFGGCYRFDEGETPVGGQGQRRAGGRRW